MATATFGAGCFWGVEEAFRRIPGVIDATSGYAGGTLDDPTYEQVCTGRTGHAEVVRVEYDPSKVSYRRLLEFFFQIHDPTTLNRQGPDVGTQYRSAILAHDDEQAREAAEFKAALEASGAFARPIVTEIAAAGPFWRAEEYHQRYIQKHGGASCHI